MRALREQPRLAAAKLSISLAALIVARAVGSALAGNDSHTPADLRQRSNAANSFAATRAVNSGKSPPGPPGCAPICVLRRVERAPGRALTNGCVENRGRCDAAWLASGNHELPSAADGITKRAMGSFLKALAAIVIGDAIDRHARRPPKYWYPNHPGGAQPGERRPDPGFDQTQQPLGRNWNPEHPERP